MPRERPADPSTGPIAVGMGPALRTVAVIVLAATVVVVTGLRDRGRPPTMQYRRTA
ncbi:hypothetical protein ACFWBB_14020 [Streptomyces sp. NPDC060000]|uniref:hypothetical protein n=1 Tax=Streptomyces sp. NPDC060000 TaxID=3347031 RepID=UPI0036AE44A0